MASWGYTKHLLKNYALKLILNSSKKKKRGHLKINNASSTLIQNQTTQQNKTQAESPGGHG